MTQRESSKSSSPRTPKVFVVILNWNGYKVTRECLLSLRNVRYPNFEVVLVDNGSKDGSEKLADEFPEIRLIRNRENLGFTGGNNVGIRWVLGRDADYILMLNNDTEVHPDFLDEFVRAGENDPEAGVLNPKIYYSDPPDRIWYAGGKFSFWRGSAMHLGYRQVDHGEWDAPEYVTFLTGCAYLIKVPVLRQIGLLDDIFFYSCEDCDWTLRAAQAGFKALYVPSAVIWHKESFDVQANAGRGFRDYYNNRNSLLLARKHLPLYCWPTFLFFLAKVVAAETVRQLAARDWARIRASYRGLLHGCTTRFPRPAECPAVSARSEVSSAVVREREMQTNPSDAQECPR